MTQSPDSDANEMVRLGLNPATIQRHAKLLLDAVTRHQRPTFRVLDTCRLDNGGLLAQARPEPGAPAPDAGGYVAFVPAAGAASRYSSPLFELSEALERGDDAGAKRRLTELVAEGARAWPLPERVQRLLAAPAEAARCSAAERLEVAAELALPKALMPCVRGGVTFLTMKHCEHARLPGLVGEVFVTPPGQERRFAAQLAAGARDAGWPDTPLASTFMEQGPALSTLRFRLDGEPFREPDGRLSPVPAGHGALAQLFPAVAQRFPGAHSLLIRNIDNVTGTSRQVVDATLAFLATHRAVLAAVQGIRAALADGDAGAAAVHADALLGRLTLAPARLEAARAAALGARDAAERSLWALQLALFHANAAGALSRTRLAELYARPVTLLGQVPNTGNDVGGTPCFIATGSTAESGAIATAKVCLEVPHASAADREAFLANPAKATHFNPVFVATELTRDPDYYASRIRSYWLLSEKAYRGQKVMYFETVLYELLGNSDLSNCVFIEVPRLLFNPHKTLKDAMGRSASDWLGP